MNLNKDYSKIIGFMEKTLAAKNIDECEEVIKDFINIMSINGMLNTDGQFLYGYIHDVYYSEDDDM